MLARYLGIATPINTTEGKKVFTTMANEVAAEPLSVYNQAIMDFGALQCTPQSPRCLDCPLVESCEASRSGRVGQLPVKLRKLKVRERRLTYLYIRYKDATGKTFIAVHRRSAADIWKGLWEPVLLEDDGTELFPHDTISLFKQRSVELFGDVKHVLTHRVLLADFYLMETNERPSLPPDYQWIAEQDFDDYGKPRLIDSHLPAPGGEAHPSPPKGRGRY